MQEEFNFVEGKNKNLIVCCDGTWNSPEQTDEGNVAPTNVSRLYNAISDVIREPADGRRIPQMKWYDQGVGAGLGRWGTALNYIGGTLSSLAPGVPPALGKLGVFIEGGMGLGIAQNIQEAYTWLCKLYQPGDRIFLFGFSRGAFTVRSLSGMIYHAGLLKSEYISDVAERYKYYRSWTERQGGDTEKNPDKKLVLSLDQQHRIHDRERVRIHFLGVWDTVAALGIPMWGWSFEVFRIRTSYHDTTLVPIIKNAYHALAMDEMRSSFMPVLLRPPPWQQIKCNFEQFWFRGAHVDIGGGYWRRGLSDIAFKWILEKAMDCGLRVDPALLDQLRPNPLAVLHDEVARARAYQTAGLWPRMFPVPDGNNSLRPPDTSFGEWHESVLERAERLYTLDAWMSLSRLPESQGWDWISSDSETNGFRDTDPHPVFDPRERRWRRLEEGESVQARIRGDQTWCPTGIVLEQNGIYEFIADGLWTDLGEVSGPEGRTTWDGYRRGIKIAASSRVGRIPVASHLVWIINVLRAVFFSPKGFAWWAKRVVPANWMELIGMINKPANWERRTLGIHKLIWYLIFDDPRALSDRQFRIGSKTIIKAIDTGPLYCFANDLWITYGNNGGSVVLSVKRLADNAVLPDEKKPSDVKWGLLTAIPVFPPVLILLASFFLVFIILLYYLFVPPILWLWKAAYSMFSVIPGIFGA